MRIFLTFKKRYAYTCFCKTTCNLNFKEREVSIMSRITSNVVEVKKQNHMIASVGSNGQK